MSYTAERRAKEALRRGQTAWDAKAPREDDDEAIEPDMDAAIEQEIQRRDGWTQ